MVTFICLYVIYMVIGTIIYDKFLIIYGRSQGNQLFTNSHLCQFIEIVHKIINWYMKNAK